MIGENTQKKGFLKCLTNFLGDSEGLTQEDMLNEMVAFSGGKITMIQRYEVAGCGRIVGLRESDDGRFILYTDHLAAIEEKDKEIERLKERLVDYCVAIGEEDGDEVS